MGFDLNLTDAELASCSDGCRRAKYQESIAEMEAAAEQWRDLDHAIKSGRAGDDLDEVLLARDDAFQGAILHAEMSQAYGVGVDWDRLVDRVANRLAELLRPVTAPTTPASAPGQKVKYDPNPTICTADRSTAYGAYARSLDESCPDWWQDDLSPMAPELATAARMRRAMWRPEGGEPR